MDKDHFCNVNLKYLPIKAHYFFLFGAMGGVVPYMPVIAKSLGVTATAVGLIYTVLPFCVFLSQPFFGYLTDYFRNIKIIMMILVIVTSLSFISVLLIPPIESHSKDGASVNVSCTSDIHNLILEPLSPTVLCSQKNFKQEMECQLSSVCFQIFNHSSLRGRLKILSQEHFENSQSQTNKSCKYNFHIKPFPSNFSCDCFPSDSSIISCKDDIFYQNTSNSKSTPIYITYQFWVFTLLAVISGTGSSTTYCLTDAACYEILDQNKKLYGRQRLWATISWGVVTLLAGYLNDIATGDSKENDYSPGFYIMLAFVLIDILILSRTNLIKANVSHNICKDLGKIFALSKTIVFAAAVYICGALSGLLWSYQFWYLQDLGASQTLLGLTMAVQCLVAEVPLFFFSGWFIKKLGYFNCIFCVFAAFALRTGLYYMLKNPWMTLPIEVTHGITFAIFYASMTSYASSNAPPGTEATMMGVFGGLFEGLGVATGSLLGGVGFDKIGGRQTFLIASVISLVCVLSFAIANVAIRALSTKRMKERRTECIDANELQTFDTS